MFQLKSPVEALKIITENFRGSISETEILPLHACLGRVLAEDIHAVENVPNFNRSAVDGYAVKAADTLSYSSVLKLTGVVNMGEAANFVISHGECAYVPTGAALPDGADAVVMLEHTESRSGGEIVILRPAAPGNNVIYMGEDVFSGKTVLKRGRIIRSEDIAAVAALGICELKLIRKPIIGIISTGDELVDISKKPMVGQLRDINSVMLSALVQSFGAEARCFGIVRDGYVSLREALNISLNDCDILLISGVSSVGQMDSTCAVINERGTLLLHGIAMKPGKPTIVGKVDGKPVFGLPGHPAAAHLVSEIFVKPLVEQMLDCKSRSHVVKAILTESVSVSHGKLKYYGAVLFDEDGLTYAKPINSKSGLISSLAGCDGYFAVPGDCDELKKGTEIDVII